MTTSEWIAAAAAVVGPLVTLAVVWGMVRQQVANLKEQFATLATRESVDSIEAHVGNLATRESVKAVEGRVAVLETDMREARDALGMIPVISEKLSGFEKLVILQIDEIKHGVRGARQEIAALASGRRRDTPQA